MQIREEQFRVDMLICSFVIDALNIEQEIDMLKKLLIKILGKTG